MRYAYNKNKYLLKGNYFEEFQLIKEELKMSGVSGDVIDDIFDMFYRNQEMGRSIDKVIGDNHIEFVKETIKAYYSNLGIKRWFKNILNIECIAGFSNGLLIMLLVRWQGSNLYDIALFWGIIFGTLFPIIMYSIRYLSYKVKDDLIRGVLRIVPVGFIAIANTNVLKISEIFQDNTFIKETSWYLLGIYAILCVLINLHRLKIKQKSAKNYN